jgi:hypothetical protein
VDGLAKASILDIDGVAVPSAVGPPLDVYTGAEAAYSIRLLRTAYTGDIMRVRRASDNNEVDVGFDSNGEFGLTSPVSNPSTGGPFTDFADFIGHGGTPTDGFCRYWYDQSGNGNDAQQATQARQPQIYDAASGIIEEGSAGFEKPALDFLGTTIVGLDATGIAMTQPFSGFYTIGDLNSLTGTSYIHGGTTSGNRIIFSNVASPAYPNINAGTQLIASSSADVGQNIFSSLYNSTSSELWQKGVSIASGNAGTTNCSGLRIGVRYNYTTYTMETTMQEIIFYDSNQDAAGNRSGIEDNMNGFYNVF